MKKRKRAMAEQIELEGPSGSTLTPPPTRRSSTLILSALAALVVIGIVGLGVAKPEIFATAVQAFSLGRKGL